MLLSNQPLIVSQTSTGLSFGEGPCFNNLAKTLQELANGTFIPVTLDLVNGTLEIIPTSSVEDASNPDGSARHMQNLGQVSRVQPLAEWALNEYTGPKPNIYKCIGASRGGFARY